MTRSADKSRSILRRLAAQERERIALEEYVRGKKYADIGMRLDVTEGAAHKIVHRALARRAEEEGPTVEAARLLYTARLEHLMSSWMPYADGSYTADPDDDSPVRPDARVGELVLKALDKWAAVMGVRAAVPVGDPPGAGGPPPLDEAAVHINIVLQQLGTAREKARVIDGAFASSGVRADGTLDDDDKPGPPPLEITATTEDDSTWSYLDHDRVQ